MTNNRYVNIRINGLPTVPDHIKTYMQRVKENGYTLTEALDVDPHHPNTKPIYEWLFSGNTTIREEAFALEWLKIPSIVYPRTKTC